MDDTILRKLARIPRDKCLYCSSTLPKSELFRFRVSRLLPGVRQAVFQVFCNADCYRERQQIETELGFFYQLNSEDESEGEPDDSSNPSSPEHLD